MKRASIFLISLLTTSSIMAQYRQHNRSAVTITVNGNNDLQVLIDDKSYISYNNSVVGNKTTIIISDLVTGQHTLQVTRRGQNANRPENISTVFSLRRKYDMFIKVNTNGSLELIERIKDNVSGIKTVMNNTNFSNLLTNVRNQRTTNGRRTMIINAFTTSNNYFSCSQVVQLLQLVNVESYRLEMAKLSYHTIVDRDNFSQVYYLLNSQASRNELDNYVNSYYEEGYTGDDELNIAMSDANFNELYRTIQQQWPVSTQMNSLTSTFNNSNNYFTTYQAVQLIQIVSSENNRLQLAKLSYRSITDRNNFSQIYNLLSYQSSKDELTNYINNYDTSNNPTVAMSDADFNTLYQTIRQQWPVSTQMNSLISVFNNSYNYFSVYQASQLIQIVSSESNRLQLAKLSYRSITDKNNFSQVYNLLYSQASRDELAAYVNNYTGGNTGYKVAMADADFNTLYQNIQMQFFPGAKMTSVTDAFNNTNYYFTCVQVKQLIELVSLESNRLQLAKLSYRTIVDRNNFTLLYDLLNSQSSKDELTAYVNAYRD